MRLLPYFDGERTPNRPHATGIFAGLRTTTSREDIARAVFEGLLCSMADAVSALTAATGESANRILLIGGDARSEATPPHWEAFSSETYRAEHRPEVMEEYAVLRENTSDF